MFSSYILCQVISVGSRKNDQICPQQVSPKLTCSRIILHKKTRQLLIYFAHVCEICLLNYLITRETPAIGGISLALRGNGTFGCGKRKQIGAPVAPHSLRNFRWIMGIPNMCLVLKLDNEKVVSKVNEQNHRVTEPSSNVLVYRFL